MTWDKRSELRSDGWVDRHCPRRKSTGINEAEHAPRGVRWFFSRRKCSNLAPRLWPFDSPVFIWVIFLCAQNALMGKTHILIYLAPWSECSWGVIRDYFWHSWMLPFPATRKTVKVSVAASALHWQGRLLRTWQRIWRLSPSCKSIAEFQIPTISPFNILTSLGHFWALYCLPAIKVCS